MPEPFLRMLSVIFNAGAAPAPHRSTRVMSFIAVALAVTAIFTPPILMACDPSSQTEPTPSKETVTSEPVTPRTFDGDVRDLPKAKPWKPGDPIVEVPRMTGSPPEPAPPHTVPEHDSP